MAFAPLAIQGMPARLSLAPMTTLHPASTSTASRSRFGRNWRPKSSSDFLDDVVLELRLSPFLDPPGRGRWRKFHLGVGPLLAGHPISVDLLPKLATCGNLLRGQPGCPAVETAAAFCVPRPESGSSRDRDRPWDLCCTQAGLPPLIKL